MSILRLPPRDRSGLNLKRFTFLSSSTPNIASDNVPSAGLDMKPWNETPLLELMKVDDFSTMFEDGLGERQMRTTTMPDFQLPGFSPSYSVVALPSTQHAVVRADNYELAATTPRRRPPVVPVMSSNGEPTDMRHTSSTSSSDLSVKHSRASSRRSRHSSMSSVSDHEITAEQLAQNKHKEVALHIRLKRRSQDNRTVKRASSNDSTVTEQPVRYDQQETGQLVLDRRVEEWPPQRPTTVPASPRRGERLGTAIAEKQTASPANFFYGKPPHTAAPKPISRRRQLHDVELPPEQTTPSAPRRLSRRIKNAKVAEADALRVHIMSMLDNVIDLLSCAMTNKEFYTTFKRHEYLLVDRVLFNQSPAAWELRYSVSHLERPSPFRMKSVLQDLDSLRVLEDFITMNCHQLLRKESLDALHSDKSRRKLELEDALWSIWTFCNLFGKSSPNDSALPKQIEWLNGGSRSRDTMFRTAIKKRRLEDTMEMWRCLEHLLSGFKGQEVAARKVGLFDSTNSCDISDTDLLDLWIMDILSRGPKAVLTLWSCDFEQAKMLGLTRWTPPAKGRERTKFLSAAVEEVYRERLMQEAKQKALDFRKSRQARRKSTSEVSHAVPGLPKSSRDNNRRASLRVETALKPLPPMPASAPPPIPRGIGEIMPDCDPRSEVNDMSTPVLSPTTNPSVFSPLSMTANSSVRLGPTLFPITRQGADDIHQGSSDAETREDLRVEDPSDKALRVLTQDMGFPSVDAKKALAMSDSGSGLDLQQAIDILTSNVRSIRPQRQSHITELPTIRDEEDIQKPPGPSKPEYCENTCTRFVSVEPQKDRVTGLGLVRRSMNARISLRRSTRLSVIMDAEEGSSPVRRKEDKPNPVVARHSAPAGDLATALLARSTNTTTMKPDTITSSAPVSAPTTPILSSNPDPLDSSSPAKPPASTANPTHTPLPANARVTLTRVGSGVARRGWTFGSRKHREPEIIGYAAY